MNWLDLAKLFLGGGISLSAIAYIAAIVLLGPIAVHSFLAPILKLLGEWVAGVAGWFVRMLTVSIPDLLSPWQTVVTALLSLSLAFGGGYYYASVDKCPSVSESIRVEYRLTKRTAAEKKDYLRKIGKSEWDIFWSKWF